MSAISALPTHASPTHPERSAAGVGGRSTSSVRSRYRRQTASLMIGTTVVGLWFGISAPSVSPVAPPVVPGVTLPADDLAPPGRSTRHGLAAEAGRPVGDDRRGARR